MHPQSKDYTFLFLFKCIFGLCKHQTGREYFKLVRDNAFDLLNWSRKQLLIKSIMTCFVLWGGFLKTWNIKLCFIEQLYLIVCTSIEECFILNFLYMSTNLLECESLLMVGSDGSRNFFLEAALLIQKGRIFVGVPY